MRKALRLIPRALAASAGVNDLTPFRTALSSRPLLVCVGSGNSLAPACYLDWLVRRTSDIHSRVQTPLEYVLEPPRLPHIVVLFSQNVGNLDARAVIQEAERRQSGLFLVCDRVALDASEVAANFVQRQSPRAFTFETGREGSFIHVIGTAAAFVLAHEMAGAIDENLPPLLELSHFERLLREGPLVHSWNGRITILRGPAGIAPARALASYLSETTGPPAKEQCLKDFTHGSYRGADQAAPCQFVLMVDRATTALFDHVEPWLAGRHSCLRLQCDAQHWSVEPFDLLILATRVFMEFAEQFREIAGPHWTPLFPSEDISQRYRGITNRFDIGSLAALQQQNSATLPNTPNNS